MIRPIAVSEAHMECRSFADTLPVLTDLMAFEEVARGPGEVTVKHPNTDWLLVVHEGAEGFPDRPTHHHFGVRVESKPEVDAAWDYLNAHQTEYGLLQLIPQVHRHGSYSIHFQEPGTNYWEIECYEDVLRKDSGGERLGAVRSRHWTEPLPESRFPGRGYVPQAFTHGTLGSTDADAFGRFAEEVLGFEVHKAYATVRYIKNPATKHFLVCLQVDEPNRFSPNFRFTLKLDGTDAVEKAHDWLAEDRSGYGLSELRPVEPKGAGASFLLRDADGNWWEYAS
jgi:catechol 2,3-dioxygenase-like lactoylglutathione lyase family enzyme